jgi:hypothetical protein
MIYVLDDLLLTDILELLSDLIPMVSFLAVHF